MPVNRVMMTHASPACEDDSCQSTMLSMQVQAGLVFAMALALTPAVLECRFTPNEQGGFPP